ncbi:Odorant receptor [Camponotus japonicus]
MDVYDDQFYGLTRRLMIFLGLWPYQNPKHRKLLLIFVSIIYVQGLIFQYTTFITHQYNMKLFIEMMSFHTLLVLFIVKYNTVYLNSTNVKLLFEQINYDCIAITDTQEIEIIQKYASRGRLYTIYFGLLIYIATILFLLTLCIPDVLNFIMPLEKPRLRLLPTPVECFVDQQKYFYVIVSNMLVIAMVGMTTFIATETMFMIFIQHACGLFAIAR